MELFDSHFYSIQAGERFADADAVAHYCRVGKFRSLNPSPYFSTDWYVAAAKLTLSAVENPLAHFIEYGGTSLCDPHPLFNSQWYKWNHMAHDEQDVLPLFHYISIGLRQGAKPHPLFWGDWYRKEYMPENSGMDPFYHFLIAGEEKCFNPNPLFDVKWYRVKYNISNHESALMNYIYGGHEARDPHPMFNSVYYRSLVSCEAISPLEHYLTRRTGVDPCILFDADYFVSQCEGIFGGKIDEEFPLFVKYIELSRTVEIDPHPLFSKAYYSNRYGDVRSSKVDPFAHYMNTGYSERRQPHPLFEPDCYLELRPDARGARPLVQSLARGLVRILVRTAPGYRVRRQRRWP